MRGDPEDQPLDEVAADALTRCLAIAVDEELGLLPRRSGRALEQMRDVLAAHRVATRGRRYALLRDITKRLVAEPLELGDVEEAMSALPSAPPLADRVSACIVGVAGGG